MEKANEHAVQMQRKVPVQWATFPPNPYDAVPLFEPHRHMDGTGGWMDIDESWIMSITVPP